MAVKDLITDVVVDVVIWKAIAAKRPSVNIDTPAIMLCVALIDRMVAMLGVTTVVICGAISTSRLDTALDKMVAFGQLLCVKTR